MKRFAVFLYVVCIFIYIRANDSDSISLSLLEENQEEYVFCLHNNTQDTIFLFDGYFEKCYDGYIYTSMYVHRYDKKAKTYKLSFHNTYLFTLTGIETTIIAVASLSTLSISTSWHHVKR